MTETDNQQADISREQLKSKPVDDWTQAEIEAGKDLSHTLAASLYNVRRLDRYGSKSQSWDSILGNALDRLEELEESHE